MVRSFLFALALLGLAVPAAAAADTLTIYTYDSFAAEWGPGPGLKAAFEKTCECTVNFVPADSSIGALRKVQLEGATTPADIVLGLDTSVAGEARATGLFAAHGLTFDNLTLPTKWTDAEFTPVDFGYFAFVYDKTKLATPPASFEDLIKAPSSLRIVLEDPRSDTPGLGLVLWIKAAYGDRAPEIWAGLKPHLVTMARGWSDAYGLFLKGEADMVLSYTTSPAYHAVAENNPNYAFADFSEGLYPQIEVAGILKSSPHQELARKFLTFLAGREAQSLIPTTNWMYPVTAVGDALPAAFPPLPTKLLTLDEATITANKAAWIDEALAALR